MDKRIGTLNIFVSIAFKALLLVGTVLVRRVLIQYIGNEANGLTDLYTSIIGFLLISELGIGEAIGFSMYRPIVEGDENKVSALYWLFKKAYLVISGVIFAAGLVVLPFLPYLAKDYDSIGLNVYAVFLLRLVTVVVSYFFAAQTSLINAYKNNYVTTIISSTTTVVKDVLQIVIVILTQSYALFLLCQVFSVLLQWIITTRYTKRKHGAILCNKQSVDKESQREIVKNVKALFLHRIGSALVNSVDGLIISSFIGVVVLGKYSNYTAIVLNMMGFIALFFTPLTSIVGHTFVSNSKETMKRYYGFFHGVNYLLGVVFFLGYYAVIDDLVILLFGGDLVLSKSIRAVITVNYFIQFFRNSSHLFRSATGTFYHDRWKPLFEGLANLILSLIFVKFFGISGVVVATIITNLLICYLVEPYVIYRHALGASVKPFYYKNYGYVALFVLALGALDVLMVEKADVWTSLICNGMISVALAVPICVFVLLTNQDFKYYAFKLLQRNKGC